MGIIKKNKAYILRKIERGLDELKRFYPETEIIFETPGTEKSLRIGKALIYQNTAGGLTIDAE